MKKRHKDFSLVKLGEECGELQHIVGKSLINPKEKTLLKLEEEIADVLAASKIVINRFGLDEERIMKRVSAKLDKYDTYTLVIDAETGLVLS